METEIIFLDKPRRQSGSTTTIKNIILDIIYNINDIQILLISKTMHDGNNLFKEIKNDAYYNNNIKISTVEFFKNTRGSTYDMIFILDMEEIVAINRGLFRHELIDMVISYRISPYIIIESMYNYYVNNNLTISNSTGIKNEIYN